MNAWRIVEVLSVLADETRYRLVTMLVQAGENGLTQGRLASRSGLSESRIKRHLAKLVQARLVRRNHRRRGIVWKVEVRQLAALVDTLTLRLKPIEVPEETGSTVLAVPGGFRSLASRLASAAKPVRAGAFTETSSEPDRAANAPPHESAGQGRRLPARRLPVKLSEALAIRNG